ncbi:hypothetical protein, partial [Nesterenkonia sp. F]|uniref:hypothetical protein n=1 Tax=Nesterenkonia sp. F TaxID=795955 RepID=UPI001ED91DD2
QEPREAIDGDRFRGSCCVSGRLQYRGEASDAPGGRLLLVHAVPEVLRCSGLVDESEGLTGYPGEASRTGFARRAPDLCPQSLLETAVPPHGAPTIVVHPAATEAPAATASAVLVNGAPSSAATIVVLIDRIVPGRRRSTRT